MRVVIRERSLVASAPLSGWCMVADGVHRAPRAGIQRRYYRDQDQPLPMAVKNPFRTVLVAPCGMDCAICMAHLREKNRCAGCRSPDREHNRNCAISSCEQRRGRYCFDCAEYPCTRLRRLDARYRKKYGMSMIGNLRAIREQGIRTFVRTERERWTCRSCGGVIDVHHGRCSACGKEREP